VGSRLAKSQRKISLQTKLLLQNHRMLVSGSPHAHLRASVEHLHCFEHKRTQNQNLIALPRWGSLYPFYSHHVHAVCHRMSFGRNQNTDLCEQPLTLSVECARVVNTVSHMCSRHVRYIQCRYAFLPNGTVESPVPSRTPTMPCRPEALLAHPLNVISGSISAYNFENEDFLYESPVYR
jgi:hypothetical protein